jgi:hypothetical protein
MIKKGREKRPLPEGKIRVHAASLRRYDPDQVQRVILPWQDSQYETPLGHFLIYSAKISAGGGRVKADKGLGCCPTRFRLIYPVGGASNLRLRDLSERSAGARVSISQILPGKEFDEYI